MEELEAKIDFTPGTLAKLHTVVSGFASFGPALHGAAVEEIDALAHALAESMIHEFHHAAEPNKAGRTDHDRTGTDDDPAKWQQGYVHTVNTVEVHVAGLHAVIEMGGGAPYVEFRQPAHDITAHGDGYLHWHDGQGWHKVKTVKHPGYPGDDFVGRAFDDLGLSAALGVILNRVAASRWMITDTGASANFGALN